MTLSAADQLAILEVITRADEAASRRDADAYVALFTEDAVLDGTQGRHAGREALRAAVGPVWAAEGPATLHLTLNPVIEPGPASDRAVARSVLLIIDPAAPWQPWNEYGSTGPLELGCAWYGAANIWLTASGEATRDAATRSPAFHAL